VTSIGDYAFASSSLMSVIIPESVTSIGDYAFYDCRSLESVYYQGLEDFDSISVFASCHALRNICVPPDYGYNTFCAESVTSSSQNCQKFRALFNHCYKGAYDDGEFIQQKRQNATDYENQSNGCIRYQCINSTGPVSYNSCDSSSEVHPDVASSSSQKPPSSNGPQSSDEMNDGSRRSSVQIIISDANSLMVQNLLFLYVLLQLVL